MDSVDFSHRIVVEGFTSLDLESNVNRFLDSARGILYAIVAGSEGGSVMQPQHLAGAAFAAIQNLDDIDAYLRAYGAANR